MENYPPIAANILRPKNETDALYLRIAQECIQAVKDYKSGYKHPRQYSMVESRGIAEKRNREFLTSFMPEKPASKPEIIREAIDTRLGPQGADRILAPMSHYHEKIFPWD